MEYEGCKGVTGAVLESAEAAVEDHGRGLLGARGGFGIILLLLLRLHEQRTLLHTHTRDLKYTGRLNSGSPTTPLISAPLAPNNGPYEEDQKAAVPDAAGG